MTIKELEDLFSFSKDGISTSIKNKFVIRAYKSHEAKEPILSFDLFSWWRHDDRLGDVETFVSCSDQRIEILFPVTQLLIDGWAELVDAADGDVLAFEFEPLPDGALRRFVGKPNVLGLPDCVPTDKGIEILMIKCVIEVV